MPLRSILDIKISAILPDLQIEIITAGREVRWGGILNVGTGLWTLQTEQCSAACTDTAAPRLQD